MDIENIPDEPYYVLLHMDTVQYYKGKPRVEALYMLYHGGSGDNTKYEQVQYYLNENNCPSNVLCSQTFHSVQHLALEEKPGVYNTDPHGMYTVKGWITVREFESLTDGELNKKNRAEYDALCTKRAIPLILERFKEPRPEWETEADIEVKEPEEVAMDVIEGIIADVTEKIQAIIKDTTCRGGASIRDFLTTELEKLNPAHSSIMKRFGIALELQEEYINNPWGKP